MTTIQQNHHQWDNKSEVNWPNYDYLIIGVESITWDCFPWDFPLHSPHPLVDLQLVYLSSRWPAWFSVGFSVRFSGQDRMKLSTRVYYIILHIIDSLVLYIIYYSSAGIVNRIWFIFKTMRIPFYDPSFASYLKKRALQYLLRHF